ncbi:MAG: DNA replication/repair protein RecF [Colwellia sp.]|nr:DNA replication/repair protein RecF [Colwellia sp.]MCW8864126.1 DNA replication/repair protein RecF [Colwellia sp.]MCW9083153.1 DNA replication/repair protein RecF [Colwellia sp.]
MTVARLTTQHFRNLSPKTIDFNPALNFFVGDNGSGKSSLLEALFYLGHGKSFRTSKTDSLVRYEQKEFVVSVKDGRGSQLGLSRDTTSGTTIIKIDGERHARLSELAKNIAIQIVTPESFKLFFGGPKERRRFTDLGMFHVKHNFSSQWKNFSRVLKQRNACIRNKADDVTLAYWTEQFCQHSVIVAEERSVYIASLIEELKVWLSILLPTISDKVTVQYLQGWSQKRLLSDVLAANQDRELSFGYSLYGAHKFDVKFLLDKQAIETQLSRGQQKLFLLALTFAQAKLIAKVNRVKPILLIDDIGAELDIKSRTALSSAIEFLNCQVIITAIEESVLQPFIESNNSNEYKVFHVKHGEVISI